MKSPLRWLFVMVCILALVAGWWGWRQGTRPQAPAAGAAPGAMGSAGQPALEDGRSRSRERATRRGGNAPSASASDAVAALVGNSSLSDLEVVAGLRRLVDDAARPIPERLEALGHVFNLASNDNPALLREIAAGRLQPAEVRLRIIAEALNRPARLQGEMLILQLENAAGNVRKEALTQLTGLCGEDLGEELAAWRAAVAKLADDR